MDANYLLELIAVLNEYYPENRYAHNPDMLSFRYIEIEDIDAKRKELKDFFIDWTWDVPDLIKGLDLVYLDHLFRAKAALNSISTFEIDEESHLISFKYNFLCDLERLYAAYDLLHEDDNSLFETLFPEITEKSLNAEIDKIRFIAHFCEGIVGPLVSCEEETSR